MASNHFSVSRFTKTLREQGKRKELFLLSLSLSFYFVHDVDVADSSVSRDVIE